MRHQYETYNIHEIKNTAKRIFPTKKFKSYLKPYWNTELSSLHKDMKTKRRSSLEAGKPRNCNNTSYLACLKHRACTSLLCKVYSVFTKEYKY